MEAVGLDLALMIFEHPEGAERVYSRVPTDGVSCARLVRHHLTSEVASALQAAVADSPSAAPPPSS